MSIIATIIIVTIALDQITKQIVTHFMELGQSISIIDNFLYLTYHRNAGAAWGILQGRMMFFYIITVIVIGGIVLWLRQIDIKKERLLAIALSLIIGGAVGNFIDRVLHQEVIDFIDTFIFDYNFPIFNVADSALVIGVALMAVDAFLEMKRSKV